MIIESKIFLRSYDLVIWLLAHPLSSVSSNDDTQEDLEEKITCSRSHGRGWKGGGRGDESYDLKKAWSSINHSILFGPS
jgi:hypothetical protein